MMPPDRKRPVTLEDILSLKRSERPPAEFWTQFDRELRAKQLAALVEKRPWWRSISFSVSFASFRRLQLPLGAAAAVVAITFVAVRGLHSPSPASGSPMTANQQVASVAAVSADKNGSPVQPPSREAKADFRNNRQLPSATSSANSTELIATVAPVVAATSTQLEPAVLEVATPALAKAEFVLSSAATPNGDLVHALVGLPGADDTTFSSPSARLIADNLAALQAEDATFSNPLLGSARAFETRGTVARNRPIEPLSQLRVQSSARRSAVISSATFVSTTAPVVTSDRAARGLSDERFYDTVSRINARGAGMLFKF